MKNTFISACENFFFNIDEITAIRPQVFDSPSKDFYIVRFKMSDESLVIPNKLAKELISFIKLSK